MPGRGWEPGEEEGPDDEEDGEEALPGRVGQRQRQPRERRPLRRGVASPPTETETTAEAAAVGGQGEGADSRPLEVGGFFNYHQNMTGSQIE